mgnify:FL=1
MLDIIPNRYNLVLRRNLFSLKNFQEMNEGTLLQIIERSITLARKHILGCQVNNLSVLILIEVVGLLKERKDL